VKGEGWRRYTAVLLVGFALFASQAVARGDAPPDQGAPGIPEVAVNALPPEARATLALIERGGPFPYDRDGIVFGNFENRLPPRSRGYYREYTVTTPGLTHRGPRRIVAGRGGDFYYTDDHYESFRRIRK
jgi:ribonuclease T1